MTLIVALLAFAACGTVLGACGGGGTILAFPIFVHVLGYSPHEAVAGSLVVVIAAALAGTVVHGRRAPIAWRAVGTFACVAVPAGLLGTLLSARVGGDLLEAAFGLLIVAVAWRMWRSRPRGREAGDDAARPLRLAGAAAFVGLMTGLLGAGGGFLIVPALLAYGGLDERRAIGTSLAVICTVSLPALVLHEATGPGAGTAVVLVAAAATVLGAGAGARASQRVPAMALRRGFAVLAAVVGVCLLSAGTLAFAGV